MIQEKLLVIDNDADLLREIAFYFSRDGFKVDCLNSSECSVQAVAAAAPSLVLFDPKPRRLKAVELCRQLREDPRTRAVPQVVMSRRAEEQDVLRWYELGVEVVVRKPFKIHELVARIKAILRRAPPPRPPERTRIVAPPDLEIDISAHRVVAGGAEVPLTLMEFKILRFLASRPERVFSREEILDGVLDGAVLISKRNIDVHVKAIREKLGNQRDHIQTVRGVGYRFRSGAPS